ncbi:hypothetical protein DIE16_31355 [Burkholderia sp. Bp9090]|uniref:phage protein n=1 Tax=Burkholderia sp. Bp9090 TaxID=2184567 RepID=UPI000F5D57A2|nr:hypothetical protein [Burkholderia sp. Bp9090]RQZ27472.1 hypothetical protein DIE16_31355 [Burkholderia sp. Bp9090]
MTQQWLRSAQLVIGDNAGNGLDLSQLHITFSVKGATTQTMKQASVRIYNAAPTTLLRIQQEFTRISLSAGYESDGTEGIMQIFAGSISKIRQGRQNATDTFIDMDCFDSDQAYNWSVTNATLAAGWSPDDMHRTLSQSVGLYGVNAGLKPTLPQVKLPRGRVLYGMTRDHLRGLANFVGCDWNLQDGQLNLVPWNGYLPGEALVLSPSTGLIGTPDLTIEGIIVRCLLNPRIKSGMRIQIDNSYITDTVVKTPVTQQDIAMPSLDPRGIYKVLYVVHNGDTRGQSWQTEMVCAAIDGTQPLSGPAINAVPEIGV